MAAGEPDAAAPGGAGPAGKRQGLDGFWRGPTGPARRNLRRSISARGRDQPPLRLLQRSSPHPTFPPIILSMISSVWRGLVAKDRESLSRGRIAGHLKLQVLRLPEIAVVADMHAHPGGGGGRCRIPGADPSLAACSLAAPWAAHPRLTGAPGFDGFRRKRALARQESPSASSARPIRRQTASGASPIAIVAMASIASRRRALDCGGA